MTKELDEQWIIKQAKDEASEKKIRNILEDRNFVLENNEFIKEKHYMELNLGKWKIAFRKDRAFSSIEVYYEIYKEDAHYQVEKFRNNNNVILDLGANEGYFMLRTKEFNPTATVICVEPNPYNFELLSRNVWINKLKNVKLLKKAVAGKTDKISLDIIEQIGNIGSYDIKVVDRKWMRDEFIKKIQVESVSLDDIVNQYDLEEIDLLKIDVEGMELEIIENSKKTLDITKRIVVERHSKQIRDKLVQILSAKGFHLILDEDPGFSRYYGDLYFERPV